MIFSSMRRHMKFLAGTPLHPQWLVFRHSKQNLMSVLGEIEGRLLDIGCGNRPFDKWLPPDVEYIGLDYPPTISKGYTGHADVFGDGQLLPFMNDCFDVITILDVMEHLPSPKAAFDEMIRVLRPGGVVIMRTPFLYPLHDLPYDFHRWTAEGLKQFCSDNSAELVSVSHYGRSLETAALLANLAIAKALLDSVKLRSVTMLLFPLALLVIPLINLGGWVSARCFSDGGFMPLGYDAVFKKPLKNLDVEVSLGA